MDITGYIFKLEENEAIIMTKDLDCYKVKRRPDMIGLGQKITFSKFEIIKIKKTRKSFSRYGAFVSGIAAVIVLLFFTFFWMNISQPNDIYAYIDVDTNLSLRLAIDNKNIVKDVNPINEDTRVLMDGLDLKSKNLNDALSDIIKKSMEKGLSSSDSNEYILISASLNSDNKEYKSSKDAEKQKLNKLLDKVNNGITEIDDANLNTKVIQVNPEIRELASKENVSMGRYVAYMKTKERGINITIDEAREISLEDIFSKVDNSNKIANNNSVSLSNDTSRNDGSAKNNAVNNTISNSGNSNTASSPKQGGSIFTNPKTKRELPSIRPIPSSYFPAFMDTPQAYNTPVPYTSFPNTPVQPEASLDLHENTIPVIVKTPPPRTFLPPRTIIPFNTPVPSSTHSTAKVETSATPVISPDPTSATPLPTELPVSSPTSGNNIKAYAASNITPFSADISGEVLSLEQNSTNPQPYYVSLVYWEKNNPKFKRTAKFIISQNLPVKLSASIEELRPGTSYEYYIAVNNILYSNLESFVTLSSTVHPERPPNPWQSNWPVPTPLNHDPNNKQ